MLTVVYHAADVQPINFQSVGETLPYVDSTLR